MSENYAGEKILQRQRVCGKCLSFVTHDKANEKQLVCPLCNHRVNVSINIEAKIGIVAMRRMLDAQQVLWRKASIAEDEASKTAAAAEDEESKD